MTLALIIIVSCLACAVVIAGRISCHYYDKSKNLISSIDNRERIFSRVKLELREKENKNSNLLKTIRDLEEDYHKFCSPVSSPLDKWEIEDVHKFRLFLDSKTGQKLLERSRSFVSAQSITLCGDVVSTQHSAGCAHGYNEFLKWQCSLASKEMLEKISHVSGAQEANNTSDSDGQAALLERLSP